MGGKLLTPSSINSEQHQNTNTLDSFAKPTFIDYSLDPKGFIEVLF